jgi:hypothetical protein
MFVNNDAHLINQEQVRGGVASSATPPRNDGALVRSVLRRERFCEPI